MIKKCIVNIIIIDIKLLTLVSLSTIRASRLVDIVMLSVITITPAAHR